MGENRETSHEEEFQIIYVLCPQGVRHSSCTQWLPSRAHNYRVLGTRIGPPKVVNFKEKLK